MSFYKSYRNRVQCGVSDKDIYNCEIKEQIIDDFYSQPNYYEVYKNADDSISYDVLIQSGNKERSFLGYKELISYPYETPQFNIGDYIHWNYGNEDTIWLMEALDKQYSYAVKGRIFKTNNDLKAIDETGSIKSYRCVKMDNVAYKSLDHNKAITIAEGDIIILVQENEDTKKWGNNKRFVFNGQAFKVSFTDNLTDENLMRFTMGKDNIAPDDDLENNIANVNQYSYSIKINKTNFEQSIGYTTQLTYTLTLNNEVSNEPVEWVSSDETICTVDQDGNIELLQEGSCEITVRMINNNLVSDSITIDVVAIPSGNEEIIITPNITEILQGDTVEYSVYKYLDGVQQGDTFTFSLSGASSNFYEFNEINGNAFTVKSNGYTATKLVVECVSDVSGMSKSIEIQLRGYW